MIVMTPKQFKTSQAILKSVENGWIKKTIDNLTIRTGTDDLVFDPSEVGVNIEFHEGETFRTIEFVVVVDAQDRAGAEFTEHIIFEIDHNGNILYIIKK